MTGLSNNSGGGVRLGVRAAAAALFLALCLAGVAAGDQPDTPAGPVGETGTDGAQGGGEELWLGTMILAIGALGTAAFGIVEGFKWTRIGNAGMGRLRTTLGPLLDTLKVAYGPAHGELVLAQYKGEPGELRRTIRQGTRIGLTQRNAAAMRRFVGVPTKLAAFKEVVAKLEAGQELSDDERRILARFETAVDARIDAALTLAQSTYAGKMRLWATGVAIAIALSTALLYSASDSEWSGVDLGLIGWALLVGVAAVPVAPVAKDLATAIQSAATALRARR